MAEANLRAILEAQLQQQQTSADRAERALTPEAIVVSDDEDLDVVESVDGLIQVYTREVQSFKFWVRIREQDTGRVREEWRDAISIWHIAPVKVLEFIRDAATNRRPGAHSSGSVGAERLRSE